MYDAVEDMTPEEIKEITKARQLGNRYPNQSKEGKESTDP
jgi:hypothetical protein